MAMKRLLSYTLLAATLTAAACSSKKESSETTSLDALRKERASLDERISKMEAKSGTSKATDATPVTVQEILPTSFTASVDVQGTISGQEDVVASPQAPGTVTRIFVSPGQRVGRGQTLAMLDAAAVEQQIAALDVQVDLTRTLYTKQQALWKQNIGTEVQLISARANYEATTKQKQALLAQRNMYRIVAPVSGTVDQFDLKVGDVASPGGMMGGIRIVNLGQLKAKANLGEGYLGKVKAGDPVTVVFSELGDSIQTRLSFVAQSVTPNSRTFGVEARVGGKGGLRPNMSCRMKIANYNSSGAITVPVNIIQTTPEGNELFIAEGKTAKTVKVETGRTYNGQVEILSGLKSGDRVVVEGYQELDNGEAISY